MKFENIPLRLDSILERELERGSSHVRVVGSASPNSVALFLSQTSSKKINSLPHLVVVPRSSDALKIQQAIAFFDSQRKVEILPHFDVSPYSGLYPKSQIVSDRLRFLFNAQNARPGEIFIAPIGSLQQKTLPFKLLKKQSKTYRKDDDLPSNINEALSALGYQSAPLVEDVGQYSMRGGILDIFSPAHSYPVRVELFGDTVESLRSFSPVDQRSLEDLKSFDLIPCRETLYEDENLDHLISSFRATLVDRDLDKTESEEILRSLARGQYFPGIEFLLPSFYKDLESPLEHFSSQLNIWVVDSIEVSRQSDNLMAEMKSDYSSSMTHVIWPDYTKMYESYEELSFPDDSKRFQWVTIDTEDANETDDYVKIPYSTQNILELSNLLVSQIPGNDLWLAALEKKLSQWKSENYTIFVSIKNKSQSERLRLYLDKINWSCEILTEDVLQKGGELWQTWMEHQSDKTVHVISRPLPESLRIPEESIILLREEELLGKKQRTKDYSASEDFQKKAKRLAFGDLKPGDCVVHVQHGIGVYDGLKIMNINGVESEFIQVGYKDKDKLYLPVYRVGQLQKYSGSAQTTVLDKLGGPGWEKTKSKVKGHLKDIAAELLQLYAKRAEMHRPAFNAYAKDFESFEASFPFEETEDQERAIDDFVKDLTSTKPMDRLVCGDVGFGKTEVAMRAAFLSVLNKKQVAVLAPTTVLTFQHLETFKKRFEGWPVEIRALNRFVSNADAKKTLVELKAGKVDILIGTHRLLSKDVAFADLGLLVVDEEQKFGVTHKEKIRKLKTSVDTLAMSATPIPRTLNMSLMGVRDLSIINTAPVDRLPTRTFITKFDEEMIRKSIEAELARGGQVYFIHNRVQSIYGLADEIKKIVPQARIKVGHGQMDEDELEKTMVSFFNHEIDVLVCTTIVESGMDISRANTMFIDQAHMMGLSQLYQLRGRVGRSKQRAYCYLILPRDRKIDKDAQERLKIIQENTALGSGIRIAQYDLELRGAGNILGESQSGHINSVGYELYLDLLNEAVHNMRGEPGEELELDPEINLRVPAMIPEAYIKDIRIRLSYYKALSEIESHEDIEKLEEELKDQFGELPEATLNLMGLMLIRSQCKRLGVRDVSAGLKNVSLIFTERTKMKPETAIALTMRENKKYSITPDNRLNIRMNNITWPAVYEELEQLLRMI